MTFRPDEDRPFKELDAVKNKIIRDPFLVLLRLLEGVEEVAAAAEQGAASSASRCAIIAARLYKREREGKSLTQRKKCRQTVDCGVADVYNELSSQRLAPGEALPRAKQAGLKAVEIDDQLAEAHRSLAVVKWLGDWDWAGAEAEFKRALELNPNAVTTHSVYAEFLLRLKRYDEALALARRAEELDPLSAPISVMVGSALYYLGRCYQAITHCRKSLALDPGHIWAHTQIASCLPQQGRREDVIAELRRAQEITRHDTNLSFLGYVYAVADRRVEQMNASAAWPDVHLRLRVSSRKSALSNYRPGSLSYSVQSTRT